MNMRPSAKEALELPYMSGIGVTRGGKAMKNGATNKTVQVFSSESAHPPIGKRNAEKSSFEKTLKLLKELNVEAGKGKYGNLIVDRDRGKMLVHYAAEKGMVEVLKEVLEEKCNIEVRADGNEWWMMDAKPIHFAVLNGWVECLKLFIEAGADVNAKKSNGSTALHVAARNEKADCVKALIEAGADLNTKDKDGWTPLHWAARNGKADCVKALIEAGADLNAKESDGSTALHVAACNGFVDCVKALVEADADLKLKNNRGGTALQEAETFKQLGCVKYLKSVT